MRVVNPPVLSMQPVGVLSVDILAQRIAYECGLLINGGRKKTFCFGAFDAPQFPFPQLEGLPMNEGCV